MNPDVAAELKDLSATLESIEAVTDLPALRAEIADLSEQAGRPDLWNDPEAAQKVTSRLVARPGRPAPRRGTAPPPRRPAGALRARRGGGRRGRRSPMPTPSASSCATTSRPGGPHPALGRVRRARGAGHHPLRGRRGGRRRLRRDAHAHVPALGRAARLRHRRLRHLLRGGGRHQVGDVRGPRPVRLRDAVGRAGHAPAGADLPVRQPGPPADLVRRRRGAPGRRDQPTTSRSTRRTCASTSTAPPAPAARASTPPTPRCGSPTCPPASSSPARTSAASCRTRPRR